MPNEEHDEGLKAQWLAFLKVILDPWVLALAVAALYSGNAALSASPNSSASALALVASLASGLLGGRIAQRWGTLTEERVTVARGKTAVRGLKLHLGSVADLERRARGFLARSNTAVPSFSAGMALEEVVGRCRLLQEQVLSSIENWTDIVPEANIKTQIGEITRLADENDEQVAEVAKLKAELSDSKNQSASAQKSLQTELERKEKLLRETQRKLTESTSSLGGFTGITLPSSTLAGSISFTRERICSKCNKRYVDDGSIGSLIAGTECPDCRQTLTSLGAR